MPDKKNSFKEFPSFGGVAAGRGGEFKYCSPNPLTM